MGVTEESDVWVIYEQGEMWPNLSLFFLSSEVDMNNTGKGTWANFFFPTFLFGAESWNLVLIKI